MGLATPSPSKFRSRWVDNVTEPAASNSSHVRSRPSPSEASATRPDTFVPDRTTTGAPTVKELSIGSRKMPLDPDHVENVPAAMYVSPFQARSLMLCSRPPRMSVLWPIGLPVSDSRRACHEPLKPDRKSVV